MLRRMIWRALTLVLVAAAAQAARAAEAYQVSTISALLAGGYDGDTTVGELLRYGNFGLRRGRRDDGPRWQGVPRYNRWSRPAGCGRGAHAVRGGGRLRAAGIDAGRRRAVAGAVAGRARRAAPERRAHPRGAPRRPLPQHPPAQRAQADAALPAPGRGDEGGAGHPQL